jgi:hypothetical protein
MDHICANQATCWTSWEKVIYWYDIISLHWYNIFQCLLSPYRVIAASVFCSIGFLQHRVIAASGFCSIGFLQLGFLSYRVIAYRVYGISGFCIPGYCLRGKISGFCHIGFLFKIAGVFVISGYCISGLWHIGFLLMLARVFVYRVIDIGFLTVWFLISGFDLEPFSSSFLLQALAPISFVQHGPGFRAPQNIERYKVAWYYLIYAVGTFCNCAGGLFTKKPFNLMDIWTKRITTRRTKQKLNP